MIHITGNTMPPRDYPSSEYLVSLFRPIGPPKFIHFDNDDVHMVVKKMKMMAGYTEWKIYGRFREMKYHNNATEGWYPVEELTLSLFQSIVSGPPKKDGL